MTEVIRIATGSSSYPFVIGAQVHRDVARWMNEAGVTSASTIFMVTDENVARTGYPQVLKGHLEAAGYHATLAVVHAGDASKSLATAQQLYQSMIQVEIRRSDVLMAVGGGMVGDLGGFVAATYLRGIRFIQVPTTLLAHDSSIGGKVGVNLTEGKNLVGAFHQPVLVLYDTTVLASLPAREWTGGLAELLKHGLIGNQSLFNDLFHQPVPEFPGAERAETLIAEAARVKVEIVEKDEREQGLRMLLNVGHTVGHAVEQQSNYSVHHGEAVAMGLIVESELAVQKGYLSEKDRDLIIRVLCLHHLPNGRPDMPIDDILQTMNLDKKHSRSGWTFALPYGIGDVRVCREITPDDVREAWRATSVWKGVQGEC